jgi:hypothetical protein
VASVLLLCTLPLKAQSPVPDTLVIPPSLLCRECQLELELQATLGTEEGEGHVDLSVTVARSERQYLVVNRSSPSEIRVFDLAGRFVRKVGRLGSGPGEFRLIWNMVVSPGDMLHVIDRENLRRTLLTPELEVAKTDRLPGNPYQRGYIPLRNGEWVLNALAPDSRGELRLMHRLSEEGKIILSFGPSIGNQTPHNAYSGAFSRVLALAQGNEIFAAGSRFRVERWAEDGSLKTVWELSGRDWIEDTPAPGFFPGYNPRIEDIRVDEEGRLWVLMRVGDPEWEDAIEVRRLGLGQAPAAEITDHHGLWDSVVEVWDLNQARVIARKRFPQYFIRFLESGELASLPEMVGDVFQLKIFRLTLNEPAQ